MKKVLTTLAVFFALAITSCGGTPAEGSKPASKTSSSRHVHTFDETRWESNETQHWHPATCEHTTQKGSAASHTFEDFTDADHQNVEATCSVPGKKYQKCSVCGYIKEITLTAAHDLQPVAHDKGEGEVTETISKCSKDDYYQIEFSAIDSAIELKNSSDKHSSYLKLSKQVAADGTGEASYAIIKFYSPVALRGRFWLDITGNTSGIWDRTTESGNHSIYYTYNDTTTNINTWKNRFELNDVEVDFANAKYTLDSGEEVEFGKLVYSDFGELASSSGATISVPMPEMNLVAGVNTLKITRLTGYAFNFHNFVFKTILA